LPKRSLSGCGISQTSSLDNKIHLQGQFTINQLENIPHKQMANLVKQESQIHQQYYRQHPLDNLHHPTSNHIQMRGTHILKLSSINFT
jgi:hypothetical protein